MGLQHCGRGYDSATLFKQICFKQKRQRRITHRCRNLSEPSESLRTSRYFGGSVSLKLENFQDVC
jgi:hypothetical protein